MHMYMNLYICSRKHTSNASMNIRMPYTAERRAQDTTTVLCHLTELQPRYQLVNCERKQRQKQYKAGITRSHEILHTVWVQAVQYFTPQSHSGSSAKCCIFMSWRLSSDSQ